MNANFRDANLPIDSLKTAIQENGVPGVSEWHSRGYLPHLDAANHVQHVAFHLADSLPAKALERLEKELEDVPLEKQDAERRKRIEDWIDAGHGFCVLREPEIAEMTQNAFLFFDTTRYRLLAWCIMPNHVHVLFQPVNGFSVAKIVASWKKFTARKIKDWQRDNPGNANLPIGSLKTAIQENGVPGSESVWHREYWDRYIRNEKHFQRAVMYIHDNPVKAGLVDKAEDWRWSSAGNPEKALTEVVAS